MKEEQNLQHTTWSLRGYVRNKNIYLVCRDVWVKVKGNIYKLTISTVSTKLRIMGGQVFRIVKNIISKKNPHTRNLSVY